MEKRKPQRCKQKDCNRIIGSRQPNKTGLCYSCSTKKNTEDRRVASKSTATINKANIPLDRDLDFETKCAESVQIASQGGDDGSQ